MRDRQAAEENQITENSSTALNLMRSAKERRSARR